MAQIRSREVSNRLFEEQVFHQTGKRVRSWMRNATSFTTSILFEDGTEGIVAEGERFSEVMQLPEVKRFCVSCGQDMHFASFDWMGRCNHTVRHFWEKVRRVYWHRYSRNK